MRTIIIGTFVGVGLFMGIGSAHAQIVPATAVPLAQPTPQPLLPQPIIPGGLPVASLPYINQYAIPLTIAGALAGIPLDGSLIREGINDIGREIIERNPFRPQPGVLLDLSGRIPAAYNQIEKQKRLMAAIQQND